MPIPDEPRLNRRRAPKPFQGLDISSYIVVKQYLNPAQAGCAGTQVARTLYMESGSVETESEL
jgi:hypothetical protein